MDHRDVPLGETVDALVPLLEVARRAARASAVELYHREADRLRVRRGTGGSWVVERGRDEGTALRAVSGAGIVGFAASSGGGEHAVRWLAERAVPQPAFARARLEDCWAGGSASVLEDHEPASARPEPEHLIECARSSHFGADLLWIEHGRTVETLVADGGLRASRTRTRIWGLAMQRDRPSGVIREQPHTLAGRSLEEISTAVPPLPLGDAVDLEQIDPQRPLVLEPRAAAVLVRALVRTLATPGHSGLPVGDGLRIVDDPLYPRGLTGGTFDDAGFPAVRVGLTDGVRLSGHLEGPGHFRRPSFRDPPRAASSTLVVESGRSGIPAGAVRVRRLRVHPLEPDRWVVEVSGAVFADGTGSRYVQRAFLPATPAELLRLCRPCAGEAEACPEGVVTPALILGNPPLS